MKQWLGRRTGPYSEIIRAVWANKDRPGYAWRILTRGVCDGCALGTTGMRDWTMDGVHLCWLRLNLLRLNTACPPLDPARLTDVRRPEANVSEAGAPRPGPTSSRALSIRRNGVTAGSSPCPWESAMEFMARKTAAADPSRIAFYLVSRGTANETYYAAQKAARLIGTPNIDNSARICHSPSTTGLKHTVGFGATTCSYSDLIGSSLVVFWGSDVANNQPVMMKYLHMAKRQGTRIVVVNPFREPGMDKFWVPSSFDSAILGTEICDDYFQVKVGGDIGFIYGVLKCLIDMDAVDKEFIADKTHGWEELGGKAQGFSWTELEQASGSTRGEMDRFAKLYANSPTAIHVWSMGITMHRHGVDNVKAIASLGLARGMVGKPHTGLMPIRGHSGVQGGAEMGCGPNVLPGGETLDDKSADSWSKAWGFPIPSQRGMFAGEMVEGAERGDLDVLYCVGSNLFGVFPDSARVRTALQTVPLRVHHDIVINPMALVEPNEAVLLLPATTRYEMPGGNTETSTERRVIFNPEIPGPRIPGARDEWRVLTDLAARVKPAHASKIQFQGTADIRQEIASLVPNYEQISRLKTQGDQFQWGGARLGHEGFGTADGKASFAAVEIPLNKSKNGFFRLSTRRGKQFNSMVFRNTDALLGTDRLEAVMSAADLSSMGLTQGDEVRLQSEVGEMRVTIRTGNIAPGTVMVYWPEANVLIPGGVTDEESGMPAYRDAWVKVMPA